MIDPDNIMSMTDFKRDTAKWVRQMRKSGRPGVLTVNGRAEAIVMDAKSYRKLMVAVERAEVIEAVQRSMKEYEQGKGAPAVETLERMRRRRKAS
jgi:PHD/YefM family antitoxin component YafN of YafNO toxin-antitoxin module